jgi:hypothetical protein
MRLARTAFAIEEIMLFLGNSHPSPLIESYLVQYILVAFYSELEEHVKIIIADRIGSIQDSKVAHFVSKTHENMIKRVKKSDIYDVLQKFGCGQGDVIGNLLIDMNLQPYYDVITNRHLVSHQGGTNMTLNQVAAALPVAEAVLSALHGALSEEDAPSEETQDSGGGASSNTNPPGFVTRLRRWLRR